MPRLRYALRSLSKAPLLSLVVVLSLGLGIGANTAIFSMLNQILLSSLAVDKPEELALVTTPGGPKSGSVSNNDSGNSRLRVQLPGFRELERQPRDLAEVAAFWDTGANLAYGNQTVAGQVMLVSGGYFRVLRVNALAGRTIAPEDDRGAGNPVAVLGYSYWQSKMGGHWRAQPADAHRRADLHHCGSGAERLSRHHARVSAGCVLAAGHQDAALAGLEGGHPPQRLLVIPGGAAQAGGFQGTGCGADERGVPLNSGRAGQGQPVR